MIGGPGGPLRSSRRRRLGWTRSCIKNRFAVHFFLLNLVQAKCYKCSETKLNRTNSAAGTRQVVSLSCFTVYCASVPSWFHETRDRVDRGTSKTTTPCPWRRTTKALHCRLAVSFFPFSFEVNVVCCRLLGLFETEGESRASTSRVPAPSPTGIYEDKTVTTPFFSFFFSSRCTFGSIKRFSSCLELIMCRK